MKFLLIAVLISAFATGLGLVVVWLSAGPLINWILEKQVFGTYLDDRAILLILVGAVVVVAIPCTFGLYRLFTRSRLRHYMFE